MQGNAISNVLMGYTPLIDRQRGVTGVRVHASAPAGGVMPPLEQLYRELATSARPGVTPLVLAVQSERLSSDVLGCEPNPAIWLEVPAVFACSAEGGELVAALSKAGFRLVLRGKPPTPLAPHLLPGFRLALIDYQTDPRLKEAAGAPVKYKRSIPYAQMGVARIDEMEAAFAHGATACVGWPWDDALQHVSKRAANPDLATITELITLIDRSADVVDLERVLRHDASLAYRLLRYINSAAFGLRVEITSFRHALMMLGYQRLRRWLALLLANSSKEPNLRPVMFASFRRGIFLEQLIGAHDDEHLRDEVFILGVFSLLDKLFRMPFEKLFETLRVPDNVYETLVSGTGPYLPYLRIAETIERGPVQRLEHQLADAVLSLDQCNQAILKMLTMPDLAKEAA